jgi:hypothetical protein
MKKCISLLLFLIMLTAPVAAGAVPSPLKKVSSSAVIFDEGTVQVVSYKAYLKVESDVTKTNASLVIKNTSPDEKASFLLGIPAFLDQGTIKVSDLTVTMDGKKQNLVSRKNKTNSEDTAVADLPDNWLTWSISLQPNENKVIDLDYTTENQKAADGTKSVFIPLEHLKSWQGKAQNVEIIVDTDFEAPYVFEPNPSVLPHQYSETGRLSWKYQNTDTPGYIRFYFRDIEQLAADFIQAQAPGDRAIQGIAEAFANKSYDTAIAAIDEYLAAQSETTLKNDLVFIKALCYQGLYQPDQMAALYDQLEGQPLFGELEGTMKNRIIYDRYHYMKSKPSEEAPLYEYLNTSRNYVMGNALFLKWMETELSSLQPPPEPEQTPTPTPEAPPVQEEQNHEKELVKTISIAGMEIPVEFVFLAVIAVIIILSLIIRKKKKYRNRGYLFR